jgi:hypothetical protein
VLGLRRGRQRPDGPRRTLHPAEQAVRPSRGSEGSCTTAVQPKCPSRSVETVWRRVRFQNIAMVPDQRLQAAVSYSLRSPPRIDRRRILSWTGSGTGDVGHGVQPQRSMRPPAVVMRGVQGKHMTQVPLTKDQHPVGDLGPHRQHEAFGEAVRSRTPGGILTTSMPASTRTASNDAANCPARSRTRNRNRATCSPRPSRGCGPAGWSRARRDVRSRPGLVGSGHRPRVRTGRRAAAG